MRWNVVPNGDGGGYRICMGLWTWPMVEYLHRWNPRVCLVDGVSQPFQARLCTETNTDHKQKNDHTNVHRPIIILTYNLSCLCDSLLVD